MIQEDYVLFETAELLKEKGFPIEEFHKGMIGTFKGIAISKITKEMIEKKMLSCIPQSVVMKWLREVFNIFIEIGTSIDLNGKYHFSYTILDKECKYVKRGYTDFDWNYKQTCETAIKFCLENLI